MAVYEQLGPYRLTQAPGVFPLGQDSLLLGSFSTLRRGDKVCDLGCGSGVLLLLAAGRQQDLTLTGVELDPAAAQLAQHNLTENRLPGQIITGDLRQIPTMLPAGSWDLILSNPPYFPKGSGLSGGQARMEHCCTLKELCAAAGWLLRNGGRFALVHRPERLPTLFAAMTAHGLEPKRLRLVQHSPEATPSVVLVEAVRQGKPGLTILPTLFGRLSTCT